MDICVFDGVASGHHHAIAQIDPGMAHAGGVVGAFEKDQISGLCFGFADVLALVPQTVGGGASYIIVVLVVHPADIAAAIKTGFRGRAAPDVARNPLCICKECSMQKLLSYPHLYQL